VSEILRSVGLDVGTTSTQLILSELTVENRAGAFSVPEMAITDRTILYRSSIHFTPLLDESRMDGVALRKIVEAEYRSAGITRESVDTGAIIITGETSRKENAQTVLQALSDLAGDFVVATAGPDLASILAAKGSGAVNYSEKTGKTVLHMDIGGGTSNLALIENGTIIQTGCLNVGGRLLKLDKNGCVLYVSPVLSPLCTLKSGDYPTQAQLSALTQILTQVLEMSAGLRTPTPLLELLTTQETGKNWIPPENPPVISFSGGIADCIETRHEFLAFGDIGPLLGQTIRESALCRGHYILGRETIRATVIGAGCHATQLSGSTVFCQNVALPLKNLPVLDTIPSKTDHPTPIYALEGISSPNYPQIVHLAERLIAQIPPPYYFCIRQDMAKALGQALAVRLPKEASILCLDRIAVSQGSYLDVAPPVAHAFPVVIKTLVLGNATKE